MGPSLRHLSGFGFLLSAEEFPYQDELSSNYLFQEVPGGQTSTGLLFTLEQAYVEEFGTHVKPTPDLIESQE